MPEGQDSNWVRDEGWEPTCSFQTFPGSERYFEPPEFCDGEVVPGTEFCTLHLEDPPDPEDSEDPEDQVDDVTYVSFGACYDFFTGDSRG